MRRDVSTAPHLIPLRTAIGLMTHPYLVDQPSTEIINERIEGYASWLEIDLDAITDNLAEIRRHTQADVMPCVKNNAYGHGLLPVAAHLADQGVKRLFVVKLGEALAIRERIGIGVVNMDPLFIPAQYRLVVEKGVTQVIYTLEAAVKLSKTAEEMGKVAGVFVKVDTGLGRVGVSYREAPDLIEQVTKLPNIGLEGIMSTLMETPQQDRLQLQRFLVLERELRARNIDPGLRSLASTDAVLNKPEAHLDLIRPGLSLYGVYPEPKNMESGFKLRQALAFKARIEYAKWIEKGDSVTYSGRYVAPKKMRVGTLHVGFYDGIPREMTNKARILVNDAYRNSLGSISLNHLLVDLSENRAEEGDVTEVISRTGENTLSKIAQTAGWMIYSVLNHLNQNTPRVYTKADKPVALFEQ